MWWPYEILLTTIEKASVLWFLLPMWLIFTCHTFSKHLRSSDIVLQVHWDRKFMEQDQAKSSPFCFSRNFCRLDYRSHSESFPEGWEVTEPITVELSCHCSQIIATVWLPISKWFLELKCLCQSGTELFQSQSLSVHMLVVGLQSCFPCIVMWSNPVYRCLTTLLKQKKWLKNMNHLPLTFWSGLSKPSLFWTIANLPTHWLGFNSSFKHSTLTALWRNHPSKMHIVMYYY